jgi:hypothetical protein
MIIHNNCSSCVNIGYYKINCFVNTRFNVDLQFI